MNRGVTEPIDLANRTIGAANRADDVVNQTIEVANPTTAVPAHATAGANRVIAVANQKGGAGKTTTVVNLGHALAQMQKKVLAVDLDPQGTLSVGLGVDGYGLQETVYTALMDGDFPVNRIIYPIKAYLDLIPANIELASAEMELIAAVQRERNLRRMLEPIQQWYDCVLIDCPPSLSLLTLNALTASAQVLVPLQCAYPAMRGVRPLLEAIGQVKARFNPDLEVGGILPTLYATGSNHAGEVLEEVRSMFGEKVYDAIIYESDRFTEASVAGQSMLEYAPDHKGADAYRQLALEIVALVHADWLEPGRIAQSY
jgi:chromosome partitioning protein